jgi:aldehyde dehydrogenase family 7 member A1
MMNGSVVASERPGHTILEGSPGCLDPYADIQLKPLSVPNPLGVVAVLSAFNFPVAVYGWYVFGTYEILNET